MVEKIKLNFLLKKKQSLKYQIMIILMEEHLRARLDYDYIGNYDGGNEIWFDQTAWGKMKNKICKYISKNYKARFNEFDDDYILGLFSEEKEFCSLIKESSQNPDIKIENNSENENNSKNENNSENFIFSIKFIMKDKGYSYQYNNYQRSQDKLQVRANQFLFITLLYYIFSWLIPNPQTFFKALYKFILKVIFNLKIEFSVIPTVLFVLFIIWFMKKILNNR